MIDKREKVLEVKDLRQHFRVGVGKKRIDVKAVDGISFDIYEGEVFGLVGESGCGKTTTGRSIIKLYRPTDGTVSFNGKIIGTGYSGNIRRIEFAKQNEKKARIEADDYLHARFKITDKYKTLIADQNKALKDLKVQYQQDIKEVKAFNEHIKTEMQAKRAEYILKISEVKYDRILKIDEINRSEKNIVEHDYKISLEAAKLRYNQKKSYLLDAIIAKDIKQTQEEEFKQEYLDQVKVIENDYLADLDQHNSEKYLKVAKNVYTKRLKDATDEERIDLEAKLESLNTYEVKPNLELSKEDRKEQIAEINKTSAATINRLNQELELEVNKISENLKDKSVIDPKLAQLKADYNLNLATIKGIISNIKSKEKAEFNDLKMDRKDNPNKYKVDKQAQIDAKSTLKQTISEEKADIKRLKKLNRITETDEEKQAKELKVKHIKQSYELKLAKLEQRKLELNQLVNGKNTNEELVEELKAVNSSLVDLPIELEREVHKAEISNSYAGVMTQLQMIFQDPVSSLNPRKTVREIISEGLIIQGIKDKDYISEKVAESLNLVGLAPEHSNRYPHEFSGGQRQRIGIARALIVNPSFIIADEPISALDVSIQAQIINLLKDLKDDLGLTILFIAHDLSVVKYFSDRIAVMYFGKIVEQTTAEELFKNPLHPYTKSLLSAIPNPDPESEKTRVRTSYDPTIHNYLVDRPKMVEIKPGHFIYANDAEVAMYNEEIKAQGGQLK